jgi:hypothetical protein
MNKDIKLGTKIKYLKTGEMFIAIERMTDPKGNVFGVIARPTDHSRRAGGGFYHMALDEFVIISEEETPPEPLTVGVTEAELKKKARQLLAKAHADPENGLVYLESVDKYFRDLGLFTEFIEQIFKQP